MGECELERQSVEEGLPERELLGDCEGLLLNELDQHSEGLPELVLERVELKHGVGLPEKVGDCVEERQKNEVALPEREMLGEIEGLPLAELDPHNEGVPELVGDCELERQSVML